jgi:3-hydroxyisobutyrate dehydrogenase
VGSTAQSVAVLGTGIMGAPIARNIARAGISTTAWNRSPEKAAPLAADGVEIADTPAEAAAASDVTLTMLADADAVRAVMGADGGSLAAMPEGAIWVQASTVGIDATEEFARLAIEYGVAFIDAPVLGTRQPAEAGELIVLAAGDQDAFARCRPIFEAIGNRTVWLGDAGASSRMKLVLNNWVLALTAGLAESIALARSLGLDPQTFLEIIEGGPTGPAYAQIKGKMMLAESFEPSFPLVHADKDAHLVLDAAEREGLELPLTEALARLFDRAAELGAGEEDMAAVYRAAVEARNTARR